MQATTLIYDGSFDGFLSCVFTCYEKKLSEVSIQKKIHVQHTVFGNFDEVLTHKEYADRVWNGLKNKLTYVGLNQIYYAFLSEQPQVEDVLLAYIRQVFSSKKT
ncbi:hypothetical protein [Tenacibaculum tangerinum]|uniref:hypothetical protein n=1 Tax=Tenacibaculum tangerinum TaxID=3038772 RepID=UPI002ADDF0CF|nr:hypothetical protein [Tenacibaculum tangerinum]